MALSVTINKVPVAASFAAGATVATAVASGGTDYTYSLSAVESKFAIDSSTGVVTVKEKMDNTNIAPFRVVVTSGGSTVTSDVVYPSIQAKEQNKFSKPNMIYKITKDIDLGNCVLTIPSGCTLDFQGGSFSNGTMIGNGTVLINFYNKIPSLNLGGSYISNITQVNTVNDLKKFNIKSGYIKTEGYYKIGDYGGSLYKIDNVIYNDGIGSILLDNGYYANIITNPEINIVQFGAKNDDPTFDCATVITNCLKYIDLISPSDPNINERNGGGIITIPSGTWSMLSTVNMTNKYNIRLYGMNNKTSILDGDIVFFKKTTPSNMYDVRFKDLTFYSRSSESINLLGCPSLYVENCIFKNCTAVAPIILYLTVNVLIRDCVFFGSSGCIYLSGSAGVGPSTSIIIQNNYIRHCTKGIIFDFSKNGLNTAQILDNIIEYIGGSAISITGNTGNSYLSSVTVKGNHIEGCDRCLDLTNYSVYWENSNFMDFQESKQNTIAIRSLTSENVVRINAKDSNISWFVPTPNMETYNLYIETKRGIYTTFPTSGPTTARPVGNNLKIGYQYFDITLGKPIWWNGVNWKDATGAIV